MPKIFRARRLVGTQEKADQTDAGEGAGRDAQNAATPRANTGYGPSSTSGASQPDTPEGRDSQGSFQSRVLPDMCLPSAPQLVHPALS